MLQIKLFCIVSIFIIVFAGVPLAAQGNQEQPAVAMDATGNFVVSWQDNHTGNYAIYVQRYDAAGNLQGTSFKVNESGYAEASAVAMDATGNFVVCWQDDRTGDYDIWAESYDAAGNPRGINFRANDDAGQEFQQFSAVAMDAAGNFVMCWQDNRAGDYEIWFQRFDAAGMPQGINFRVDQDGVLAAEQWFLQLRDE